LINQQNNFVQVLPHRDGLYSALVLFIKFYIFIQLRFLARQNNIPTGAGAVPLCVMPGSSANLKLSAMPAPPKRGNEQKKNNYN